MAFEVSAVGTISNGRVFFDATAWTKTKLGLPDGLKVDKEGNLFATGPGGLHVFARDGTHLGSIEFEVCPLPTARGVVTALCSTSRQALRYIASRRRLKAQAGELVS